METTFLPLFLSALVFLQKSHSHLVPALHIFGDDAVDAGNTLFLNTSYHANHSPYGDDFVIGTSGRFSNGDLIVDVLANALGLDMGFAIVNGTNSTDFIYNDNQAFNYAYGTAGILPDTGRAVGETLSLGQQIGLFRQTVEIHLPQHFKRREAVSRYISDSLFVVFIGSNDYIHNYLQPRNYDTSRRYTFEEFAELLVQQYGELLTELHSLGAKRMVVFEIPPIGCYPIVVENVKSNHRCAENVNRIVGMFNEKLGEKVKELSSKFKDSTIILARTYALVNDMINNPSAYGLEETEKPCCVTRKDGSGLCVADEEPCEKRNKTLFWDEAHMSKAASEIVALKVFNGSGHATPVNIVDSFKNGSRIAASASTHSPTSISHFNLLLLLVFSAALSFC